ncbi:ferrous iron transport protein B [Chloroflexota bacterium]
MAALSVMHNSPVYFEYDREIEKEIKTLSVVIEQVPAVAAAYNPRWLAIQLLEGDEGLSAEVQAAEGSENIIRILPDSLNRLRQHYDEDLDCVLAERRYNFVHDLTHQVLIRPAGEFITTSDKVDKILTHRWFGIPIFLALMWVVFKITTDIATPYLDWVDSVITGPITRWVVALLGLAGLGGSWVESLFVDGIIAGVGGVLVFVPILMSLYLALAILEDSGYMARAAFVMDRLMSMLGLHGKSFLPMVVGFGCTVPALYATRTLENEKDRILTGLLVPFMSCGARLPVYVLFAAIFFPKQTGLVIFSLYLIGIATAIVLGLILKSTLFKGKEQMPFVMELPPYRLPTPRNIWAYVWSRTSSFIHNAWTIILATSVVIWLLMATPVGGSGTFANTDVTGSVFATVSGATAKVFTPLGFGSWEAGGALITGFVAKEVVVSTMAQVYNVEEVEEETEPATFIQDIGEIIISFAKATLDTIKSIPLIIGINLFEDETEEDPTQLMAAVRVGFEQSSGGHGALAAFAFMVFVLLYTPCVVSVAAERQELGTRWMWLSIFGQFGLAWVAAFIVFQGGKLLGLG